MNAMEREFIKPSATHLYSTSDTRTSSQDTLSESSKGDPLSFQAYFGFGFSSDLPLEKAPLDGIPKTREIMGWCLYEFGMSGYKIVLWFFFPLLLFTLFAQSQESGSADHLNCSYGDQVQDSGCLRVCDDFTYNLRMKNSSLPGSSTIILKIFSESLEPAFCITAMLGASVVVQIGVLIVASPLLDYGRLQKLVLGVGTGVGAIVTAMVINIFQASWWWIGNILFLVSSVALGLASASYERHFSSLTRGIPIVRRLVLELVQIHPTGRTRSVNTISLTGVFVGSLAITICTLVGYFLSYQSSLLADNDLGYGLLLRFTCFLGGLWWGLWTLVSYVFIKNRPGPSYPGHTFSAVLVRKHLPDIFISDGVNRNAFLVLLVCFLSSISNATLFQSGALCFSTRDFVKLLVVAQVFCICGTVLFFFVQNVVSRSNKLMLVIVLLVQLLPPIYACIGFLTRRSGVGLKHEWEFIGLACVHGACLGTLRSYTRTVFLDCIPTSKAGAHFSLLTVATHLGTFTSGALVLILVYTNANLRYLFVVNGISLALAIVLLVNFIGGDKSGGCPDDDESLVPASLISGSVVMTSSSLETYSLGSSG